MSGLQNVYKEIFLDSVHFIKLFQPDLIQLLQLSEVCVADTRDTEVAMANKRLKGQELSCQTANEGQLKQLSLKTKQGDVWTVLKDLSNLTRNTRHRYLFVVSNQLRMMWVILRGLPIDVYDVAAGRLIPADSFEPYARENYLFEWELGLNPREEELPTADTNQKRLTLYDETGKPVVLNRTNNRGSEAYIYKRGDDSEDRYKIFMKGSKFNAKKVENIRRLRIFWNLCSTCHDWARFPIDLVYLDPACQEVAGYRMRGSNVSDYLLDNCKIYDYSNHDVKPLETVELLKKLIWQFSYLSAYGFYAYDFGSANFAYDSSWDYCIMMDTDSLCSSDYFTWWTKTDFGGSDYFKQGETGKLEALEICFRMTYLFAAWTLLRSYPARTIDNQSSGNLERYGYRIHPGVLALLIRILEGDGEYLPFYDSLLRELDQASRDLADRNITYGDLEKEAKEKQKKSNVVKKLEPEPKKREEPRPMPQYTEQSLRTEWPSRPAATPKPQPVDYPAEEEFYAPDEAFLLPNRHQEEWIRPVAKPRHSSAMTHSTMAPAPLRRRFAPPDQDLLVNDGLKWRSRKRRGWMAVALLALMLIALWMIFFADIAQIEQMREFLSDCWNDSIHYLKGLLENFRSGVRNAAGGRALTTKQWI